MNKELEDVDFLIHFKKYCAFVGIFFYFPVDLIVTNIQKRYSLSHLIFAFFWIGLYLNLAIFLPWLIKYLISKYESLQKKSRIVKIIFINIYIVGYIAAIEYYVVLAKENTFFPNNKYKIYSTGQHLLLISLPVLFFLRDVKFQLLVFAIDYLYFGIRTSISDFQNIGECIKTFAFAIHIFLMFACFLSFREKNSKDEFIKTDCIRKANEEWKKIFSSLPQTVVIMSNNTLLYTSQNTILTNNIENSERHFIFNDYEDFNNFFRSSKIIINKEEYMCLTIDEIFNKLYLKSENISNNSDKKNYLQCFVYPKDQEENIIECKILEITFERKNCYLFLLEDISERNLIQVLKKNDDFKNQLISSFSHEIKTPINGANTPINDCIEDPNVSQEIKDKYIKPIKNSLHFLECVASDMIDFGSISTNQFSLFNSEINMKELGKELYEIIEPLAKIKDLEFTYEVAEDVEIFENDQRRISQVIINLLRNAVKFTENGKIQMNIKMENHFHLVKILIDNKVFDNDKYIKIEVQDTGIGMNEEQQQELRKILFLHDLSNMGKCSLIGGGLGLIISQNIAKKIGPPDLGITFTSCPAEGSSFCIYLENKKNESIEIMEEEKEDSFERPISQDSSLIENSFEMDEMYKWECAFNEDYCLSLLRRGERRKKNIKCCCPKIMIVDDESFNLLALEMILKPFRIKYVKAFNGILAVEKFKSYYRDNECTKCRGFELILMDIQMPGMNGFQATKEIKKYQREKMLHNIPIITCTAFNSKFFVNEAKEAGMVEFFSKPINKELILKCLLKYFGKK